LSGKQWESPGVFCQGSNGSGELGNNTTTDSNVPVQVSGLAGGVTAISTGVSHACVALADTSVLC
jgi:hypothetical protein